VCTQGGEREEGHSEPLKEKRRNLTKSGCQIKIAGRHPLKTLSLQGDHEKGKEADLSSRSSRPLQPLGKEKVCTREYHREIFTLGFENRVQGLGEKLRVCLSDKEHTSTKKKDQGRSQQARARSSQDDGKNEGASSGQGKEEVDQGVVEKKIRSKELVRGKRQKAFLQRNL